jgi:DNA-binding XRE family transcriptional regulator
VSGHKSYKKLREKVRAAPERRKRVEEIGKAYDALLALGELREYCGLTQADLAREMGVSQPNISKIENNADPRLSTLDSFVRALGGHLEVKVVLPERTIDLALPGRREGS